MKTRNAFAWVAFVAGFFAQTAFAQNGGILKTDKMGYMVRVDSASGMVTANSSSEQVYTVEISTEFASECAAPLSDELIMVETPSTGRLEIQLIQLPSPRICSALAPVRKQIELEIQGGLIWNLNDPKVTVNGVEVSNK